MRKNKIIVIENKQREVHKDVSIVATTSLGFVYCVSDTGTEKDLFSGLHSF